MNILHVLSSGSYGGLELYVVQLVKEQVLAGLNVSVCIIKNSPVHKALAVIEKLDIFFIKSQKKINISDTFYIKKIIGKKNIDIVHTHTSKDFVKLVLVTMFIKVKIINSFYIGATKKKGWLHGLMYKKLGAFITSSLSTNDFIKENYPIDPNIVHLVPYGREIEKYNIDTKIRDDIRLAVADSDGKFVIMSMSRIDPVKGIAEFARSMSLLNEEERNQVQYWIIGENTIISTLPTGEKIFLPESLELDSWLEEYIIENKLENKIKRFPFQQEFINWLSAADIVILPSYNEMYSLTVIDAMLMHKPIIGTNTGGTSEQVQDKINGILIEPRSPEAIAEAVKYYLQNPGEIEKHGENAFRWAYKTHSMQESMKKLITIYNQVLSKA